MAEKANNDSQFISYRGKPLVRQGNTLYYGFPYKKYIAMLQILGTEKKFDEEIPTNVSVALISTDESLPMPQRIIDTTVKKGLYPAMLIANIWLDRKLSEESSEGNLEAQK